MFKTPAFDRKGEPYGAATSALCGEAKATHQQLQQVVRHLQFRRYWEDHLSEDQKRNFSPAPNIEGWERSRQAAEVKQDVEKVPLISVALLLDERGEPERFSLMTYSGRGADFYLPAMKGEGKGAFPIPQVMLEWLEAEEVQVVGSGFKEGLAKAQVNHGMRGYVDTATIFAYFVQVGLIHYHGKGTPPVELAAQLAFCTGYHHLPDTKQRLCDLLGACNFKGTLPYHRAPSYRVPKGRSLNEEALFNRYYEVAGPLCLLYRLVEHGLLFGTVEGVTGGVAMPETLRRFLACPRFQEGEQDQKEEPVAEEDLFPEPPTKMDTTEGGRAPSVEVVKEVQPVEADAKGKEKGKPLQSPPGEEAQEVLDIDDDALVAEVEKLEEEEEKKILPPGNNEAVPSTSRGYYTSGFQRQVQLLPRASTGGQGKGIPPPPFPLKQPKDGRNPAEAPPPRPESSPEKKRRVEPPPRRSPPREMRRWGRGSASRTSASRRPPPPGRPRWWDRDPRRSDGGPRAIPLYDQRKGPELGGPNVTHHHQDLRSRLIHNLPHSHGTLAREATASTPRRPAAAPKPDGSLALSRKVELTVQSRGFAAIHRYLPIAESDGAVANREKLPLDLTRLGQTHLSRAERYENRFKSDPVYESRCDYCGGRRCSRMIAGTSTPNCARYIEQIRLAPTRRVCNYRRCKNPTTHLTHVCPTLIQRCPRCQCRGHGPSDLCDPNSEEVMDRLRADFEEVADAGTYTNERQRDLCWGFYPYPRGSPIEFRPADYDALTDMPVLHALDYLANLLSQPENQGHLPDFATEEREAPYWPPSDRDRKDPPPPPPGAGAAGIAV